MSRDKKERSVGWKSLLEDFWTTNKGPPWAQVGPFLLHNIIKKEGQNTDEHRQIFQSEQSKSQEKIPLNFTHLEPE